MFRGNITIKKLIERRKGTEKIAQKVYTKNSFTIYEPIRYGLGRKHEKT
jgi:hypothetical protein